MENQARSFDQWTSLCQSQCEKMLKTSSIGIECTEKILQLQMTLFKDLCLNATKALQDSQGKPTQKNLLEIHQDLTKPTIEKSMATSNAIYQTLTDMHAKLLEVSKDLIAEESKALSNELQHADELSRRSNVKTATRA